mmetsp:Transcript_54966/g.117981  ORF Transcript_54966/g.117981 Transcript_54966/m.117981 type:complete len:370 (+) Transcript_54966:119-1228(+)
MTSAVSRAMESIGCYFLASCCKGSADVGEINVKVSGNHPNTLAPKSSEPPQELSDEDANARMKQVRQGGRRAGVAAEGMSNAQVKDYKAPVYQKSQGVKDRIRRIITENAKTQVLFGHVDKASVEAIINAFEEVSSKKGETVIKQGDEGDCLYIISEGTVDVFVARPDASGKAKVGDIGAKVVSLEAGALFGELALMYSAPRAASVVITSPICKLWRLGREPFKMLMTQQSQNQYAVYEGWLSEVELFQCLNSYELSRLSDLMESQLFSAGEDIVVQGETGEHFYILEDGSCAAYIKGPKGESEVKKYDTPGDYFGEIALIKDVPRKATVRATGEGASVLCISKEDFVEVLGPIQDRLAKDIDKYQAYT